MPRVDEDGHTLTRARDSRVHCHALSVTPAPLHIVLEQMLMDSIENNLGYLRSRCIIKEDEIVTAV
jgi:hypothetical protein